MRARLHCCFHLLIVPIVVPQTDIDFMCECVGVCVDFKADVKLETNVASAEQVKPGSLMQTGSGRSTEKCLKFVSGADSDPYYCFISCSFNLWALC